MNAQPLRIMIADDEEVVRLFMARVLEDLGYTCRFAVDGRDCLKKLGDGNGCDLLLLDLVMPRLDGEQVLREVHEKHPDITVVMVSVQDDEEAIKELLADGASAYLTKPVKAEALRQVVSEVGIRRTEAGDAPTTI